MTDNKILKALKMLRNFLYPQLPYKICDDCEDLESQHDNSIKRKYKCKEFGCICRGFRNSAYIMLRQFTSHSMIVISTNSDQLDRRMTSC